MSKGRTGAYTIDEDVAIIEQFRIHGKNTQKIKENLQNHNHILLDLEATQRNEGKSKNFIYPLNFIKLLCRQRTSVFKTKNQVHHQPFKPIPKRIQREKVCFFKKRSRRYVQILSILLIYF